ncbi:hypothetical protein LJC19_00085 [Oxalobacter sp. OttesenSCG-928-P03]|nr:hypothetical protein [Oxalobacter sp. OttesenSCG-928-P03]
MKRRLPSEKNGVTFAFPVHQEKESGCAVFEKIMEGQPLRLPPGRLMPPGFSPQKKPARRDDASAAASPRFKTDLAEADRLVQRALDAARRAAMESLNKS